MRHLVTGGCGFIGSHLCDALVERGEEVIALDNLFTGTKSNIWKHPLDQFDFVRHDVCEPFHFEVDRIWHLACPASPVHYQRNPARTIETALLGTRNALECARITKAPIVVASTSEIYGDPTEHPQRESYWGNVNTLGSRSCYDEGKRAGESLAYAWNAQYGVDVRIARIFNTYGPRMRSGDGRIISNFITQAMRNERLTIYGNGSQTRSFCYVDDTVRGLLAIGECVHAERVPVFNLGNPHECTVLEVAERIVEMVRGVGFGTMGITSIPLPEDDPKRRCPDISRAKAILGWEPTINFIEGLSRTVEWFRSQARE
jgi:UDP-glucuronate decarboxylase